MSCAGVIGVVVAAAVFVATRSGIGVTTDGVAYLQMAEAVARLDAPYPTVVGVAPTHYGPGWSILVGLVSIPTGLDVIAAARWVNVVVAAAVPVVAAGVLVRSQRNGWLPLLAIAHVGLSYQLFLLSASALTETLFVVLTLAALGLLDRMWSTTTLGRSAVALLLSALVALTRLIGVVITLPVALWAWARGGVSSAPHVRAARAGVVASMVVAPLAVWFVAAPSVSTSIHFESDQRGGIDVIVWCVQTAAGVLSPSLSTSGVLPLVLGFVIIAFPALPWLLRRVATPVGADPQAPRSDHLWYSWFVAYAAVVFLQRWWSDQEPLTRLWVPYWIVAVVFVVGRISSERRGPLARPVRAAGVAALACVTLLTAIGFVQLGRAAVERSSAGSGINSVRYQESVVLERTRALGSVTVYTDRVRMIEFHAPDASVATAAGSVEGVCDMVELRRSIEVVAAGDGALVLVDACREAGAEVEAAFEAADVLVESTVGVFAATAASP